MKAVLGFALTTYYLASAASVTPVQQAINLLEDMTAKAKAAKHEENVQFAGFSEFCKNVQAQKAKDIEAAKSEIELLNADIEKANSEVERLAEEIKGHEKDIAGWATDQEDATKVRHTERDTFLVTQTDYQESLSALDQAIILLKKQDYNRDAVPGALSLLQKVASLRKTPEDVSHAIHAFLEFTHTEDPNPEDNLGYQATAYKFQSGDIITMMEKLKAEFKDELTKLEKEEVARTQTYDSLSQDLHDQTEDAKNSIQEKTLTLTKNKQMAIDKTADLQEVTAVKDSDEKYLKDLTELCEQKTTEFEARTKLREEEIEALEKAVDILTGSEVDDAKKHLPSLAQAKKTTSLAQLRSSRMMNPNQLRVIDFLREASVRLESHDLSALAMKAAADPFAKVKQLISELIERLMTQATNEATHKGWCDKELATNKHTRETKSAEVDTLRSTIDGLDADIASLTKEIEKKTEEVAKIEADVAEFTEKRNKESEENAKTVKEAQDGQSAIANAIKVLEDFYAKAAKATALQQKASSVKQQPEAPEIFEGAYKGQQSAKGGVIGMLEVIQSDFARLEADTKSAEQSAQNEYDEFMSDSAQAKAVLEVDLKHAKTNKMAKEGELTVAKDSLKSAETVLESAMKAYESLKEPCLGGGQTYAERKANREQEIEALKQALELLSADNLPTM